MDQNEIESTDNTCRLIGTSNHGFAHYAQMEIRKLFAGATFTTLVKNEIFLINLPVAYDEAAAVLADPQTEPIFLRHVHPVMWELPIKRDESDLEQLRAWVGEQSEFSEGEKVAVQTCRAAEIPFDYTVYGVKAAVDPILQEKFHTEPVVQHMDKIISVYLSADRMYVGISLPELNLSDWSGGAIRFRRDEGLISRAMFKLLEAEIKFHLPLQDFKRALDIGAAPGGWTSLLLERGLKVTAVDPSELDERLNGYPGLTFIRDKAEHIRVRTAQFDLLTCDMNWDPERMGKLIDELSFSIKDDGYAFITLKLLNGRPFQTLQQVKETLDNEFELIQAKQLFHNRDEITLFLRRR